MSLFPRFQEFSPLFRLMDEYDRATRPEGPPSSVLRTFTPKFDVKELKESYELHGELPGIEQKNIDIEWTDGNTLTISGRTEHRSERGTRPSGFIEGEVEKTQGHKQPTVEDEGAAEGSTAVTTTGSKEVGKPQDKVKYWVSERSVGEFHRTFSFPTRVDQDNVKASLKDGILTIFVPKSKAPQPRKISIQ